MDIKMSKKTTKKKNRCAQLNKVMKSVLGAECSKTKWTVSTCDVVHNTLMLYCSRGTDTLQLVTFSNQQCLTCAGFCIVLHYKCDLLQSRLMPLWCIQVGYEPPETPGKTWSKPKILLHGASDVHQTSVTSTNQNHHTSEMLFRCKETCK